MLGADTCPYTKTAKNGQKQAIWWIHQFNCVFQVYPENPSAARLRPACGVRRCTKLEMA